MFNSLYPHTLLFFQRILGPISSFSLIAHKYSTALCRPSLLFFQQILSVQISFCSKGNNLEGTLRNVMGLLEFLDDRLPASPSHTQGFPRVASLGH